MDYEFRRDIYGQHQATFSMGHEALGLWLTEELGENNTLINTLLTKIEQLQNQQCWEYHHPGKEFMLTMNQEGIEVRAALLDDLDDQAPEGLSHYDDESHANCGLDDFQQLLKSWQVFITPA